MPEKKPAKKDPREERSEQLRDFLSKTATKTGRKLLPTNMAMYLQELAGNHLSPEGPKTPLTEADLTKEELAAYKSAYINSKADDRGGNILYSDYKNKEGVQTDPQNVKELYGALTNPYSIAATTVGRGNVIKDDKGNVRIQDTFDFAGESPPSETTNPVFKAAHGTISNSPKGSAEGKGIPVDINLGAVKTPPKPKPLTPTVEPTMNLTPFSDYLKANQSHIQNGLNMGATAMQPLKGSMGKSLAQGVMGGAAAGGPVGAAAGLIMGYAQRQQQVQQEQEQATLQQNQTNRMEFLQDQNRLPKFKHGGVAHGLAEVEGGEMILGPKPKVFNGELVKMGPSAWMTQGPSHEQGGVKIKGRENLVIPRMESRGLMLNNGEGLANRVKHIDPSKSLPSTGGWQGFGGLNESLPYISNLTNAMQDMPEAPQPAMQRGVTAPKADMSRAYQNSKDGLAAGMQMLGKSATGAGMQGNLMANYLRGNSDIAAQENAINMQAKGETNRLNAAIEGGNIERLSGAAQQRMQMKLMKQQRASANMANLTNKIQMANHDKNKQSLDKMQLDMYKKFYGKMSDIMGVMNS